MLLSFLTDFGLFLGFIFAAALLALLLKVWFKMPFEPLRKLLHMIVVLSIFPLLELFNTWYEAVLAAFLLVVLMYPVLALVENASIYKRFAPERNSGEFKRSLVIVQVSMASLITVFWGILGPEWRYIAVAAVMAWGFGDAAAALVGKAIGHRKIRHRAIEGTKTMEGTLAMYIVAGTALFFSLLIYASQPWYVSLAVALLVAPVCAVVELFSNRGMDTITVPISAGISVLSWMALFSFLGI